MKEREEKQIERERERERERNTEEACKIKMWNNEKKDGMDTNCKSKRNIFQKRMIRNSEQGKSRMMEIVIGNMSKTPKN